ncbi:MAG: ROK family transcriptional regulator [Bacteroidales bacterium]|nr:ROK family transcriptional regulator [Bacteroidales bacterium]
MRNTFLERKDNKNSLLKKNILFLCIEHGEHSISALSDAIGASVPTVTKLIGELMDEGFMIDLGKSGTSGGRRPSIYGLNPEAGYFIGVELRNSHACIAVTDFKGGLISFKDDLPFRMTASEPAVHDLASKIREYISKENLEWNRIMGLGISMTGRVNPVTGYSNTYSFDEHRTISRILEEDLGIHVALENDSRAMTYGEYLGGGLKEKNMLFVNVSWGLGMGIIADGKLYYGTSGFSGEFGHFPILDNGQMCRCGKVGCLETGASGSAIVRMISEKLASGRASVLQTKFKSEGKVNLNDIFDAVKTEDTLTIETIEKIGTNLGKGLAGLINIFNPQLVVIGGKVAVAAGDYLMLPIRTAIKRHVLNIANQDTTIKLTKLRQKAAPIGAALLVRSRILGML